MRKPYLFQAAYWLLATFVLAGIYTSFLAHFIQAWMLSTMLLPGALLARTVATRWSGNFPKKLHYWLYLIIGVLWLEYLGAIAAYWLLFELDPEHFPKVLINPIFSLFWISALVLAEQVMTAKFFTKQDPNTPLSFVSNRKEYTLPLAELAMIESRDRITIVHGVNGLQWTTTRSIKHWESEITGWIRIHRSFLINPLHIEYHKSAEVGLRLQNKLEVLPISRSYKGVLDTLK